MLLASSSESSDKEPKEIDVEIRSKTGSVKTKKILFQGFLNQHYKVPAQPLTSCCYEMTRKNGLLSQAVVAINQALDRFTDLSLLRGAIANTADLAFTVRYHRPHLFFDNETFVQMAAVAQNFPFSLDLQALDGAIVAG